MRVKITSCFNAKGGNMLSTLITFKTPTQLTFLTSGYTISSVTTFVLFGTEKEVPQTNGQNVFFTIPDLFGTLHSPVCFRDTRWRNWLTHCATSRKVAGLIPDGVIEIFH
jgi:hypothetical protein